MKKFGEWRHGYKRYSDSKGGWIYYIRERRPGVAPDGSRVLSKQFERCTGVVDDEELANLHYERFQKNPEAYDPAEIRIGRSPLPLAFAEPGSAPKLLDAFLAYLVKQKQVSPGHLSATKGALKFWADKFPHRNLRNMSAEDFRLSPLPPGGRLKLITIKHLINWCRRKAPPEFNLTEGERLDATAIDAPQSKRKLQSNLDLARTDLHKGSAALLGYARVMAITDPKKLPDWVRATLKLQASTGLHNTEVERWCALDCPIEPMPEDRTDGVAVLPIIHKSDKWHRVPLSQSGLTAALAVKAFRESLRGKSKWGWTGVKGAGRKLHDRRPFPRKVYERLIRELCRSEGIPEFGPGHLRHAFATYAYKRGFSLASIAAMTGHVGEKMLEERYVDPIVQVPAVRELPDPADLLKHLPTPQNQKVPAALPTMGG